MTGREFLKVIKQSRRRWTGTTEGFVAAWTMLLLMLAEVRGGTDE